MSDWRAVDWLIREYIPAWLGLADLNDSATALRKLPPVTRDTLGPAARALESAEETVRETWEGTQVSGWERTAAAWDAVYGIRRDLSCIRIDTRRAAQRPIRRLDWVTWKTLTNDSTLEREALNILGDRIYDPTPAEYQ